MRSVKVDRLRIAILAYEIDDASGSSLVAIQQASLFACMGCDVTFFTLRPGGNLTDMPVKPLKPPLGLPLWRWQVLYPFELLPPPLHLPLIYRSIKSLSKFDAVVAFDYPFSWFGYYAKKLFGVKYVWFLQGVPLVEGCQFTWEKMFCWMQTYGFYRRSAANADIVITETHFLKGILKQRFNIESVVIPNLTHISFNLDLSGDEIRQKYQLEDEPMILYVDRLEEDKGIETLLDSFNIARETIPNARLMLIGRCRRSYWPRIRERLDDRSVIHLDYVPHDEIDAFYAAATVFATCADWEPEFSHTMVEAQALGKPVVAFNVGAHREVVRNGETGILVDQVGGAQQFASALVKLLNDTDLAGSMGGNAVKWAGRLANQGITDFGEMLNSIKD